MCGIAGIWKKNQINIDKTQLINMRDALLHRGPDAAGIYVDNSIGFAHRRLSIIDLSESANQPFQSTCGRYILVYNGEIFNYKEFYNELKEKGYKFNTESDTEVLLNLFIEYGVECLKKLNGFFAFSFWDKEKKELIVVRDRFGVKPLFYVNNEEAFYFASEPKAFFKAGLPKMINEDSLDELFYYRHVSGENTIFKNVKRVLPGHYWIIKNNATSFTEHRWFHLGEEARNFNEIKNPTSWFEETLYESIRYRMIADVKIGTLLSGGLDSSSVAYCQYVQNYKNLSSWNISFSKYEHDESILAKKLSDEFKMKFHSFEFTGNELVKLVLESIYYLDEPQMHLQEGHLLGLAKEAKKEVSVLLSGEAADELMGGYVRYKMHDSKIRYECLQLLRYIPDKWLKEQRWKKMKKYLYMPNIEAQLIMNANSFYLKDLEEQNLAAFNLLPEYRIKLLNEAKEIYPKNQLRQLLYIEQYNHIGTLNDRNDRTSMGASIESREPFLDYRLVTGIASLDDKNFNTNGKGKYLLMNSIGKKLPSYIQNHRKIGLSIPWEKYFEEIPFFKEHLNTMHLSPLFQMGNYSQINVYAIVEAYKNGDTNSNSILKNLFFLSLWYRVLFESSSIEKLF